MKATSLIGMSKYGALPPRRSKILLSFTLAGLWLLLLACTPVVFAEVLYEETFDRPLVTAGLGATDERLGWITVTPLTPTPANVFVKGSDPNFSGLFLSGSTANGGSAENVFYHTFPGVTSGTLTLSCVALAHSTQSLSSTIGLTHQVFSSTRKAQWTCASGGWVFYVGRLDQTGQPYTIPPVGVVTGTQEMVTVPSDIPVTLKIMVDQDHNKTWGQANWVASGTAHTQTTAQYDWDAALGEVSMVYLVEDRRSSKVGMDVDNIKVEGIRHVPRSHPFLDSDYTIYQMNGTEGMLPSPAQIRWVSQKWAPNSQMPYLAYMPEQSKLIMLLENGIPVRPKYILSTDGGLTWNTPTALPVPDAVLGLTYLGGGNLLASESSGTMPQLKSANYGSTWTSFPASPAPTPNIALWNPATITSVSGGTSSLISAGYVNSSGTSQGYKRFSTNSGATWSNPTSVSPQWTGVSEVTITKAGNGNLVAACRTDPPTRFAGSGWDNYSGLAVSISTDNGTTWSALTHLYSWGRHHASIVLLPNNDLLMTYAVRMGYTTDANGFPRFGVEAVISKDNGATWDIDHRIILAEWTGNARGDNYWFGGVQSTSSVILPDGTVVTAFGTGFNGLTDATSCVMDIALVRWQIPANTLNSDNYLSSLNYDSDGRNIISPNLPTIKKTVSSTFSLGYGWNTNSWNTAETSTVNIAPSGGFTLGLNLSGATGSTTGPTFINRVLGSPGSGTLYQSAIVSGFQAVLTGAYSGTAPSDAATYPNYRVGLDINAISMQTAPNVVLAGQTANFCEVLTTGTIHQTPQPLVETASFNTLPGWSKTVWDPVETGSLSGPITQTNARTFKLEQNASFNVFIDGFEALGDVGLTYDATRPVVRKTITGTFSKGFGWNNNSWNTTETASTNIDPDPAFQLSFNFGSPGSATLSTTGPAFTVRSLGPISTGAAYQSSFPPGFVASVSGAYVGTLPLDAAANPNCKIRVYVDSISVYSAPVTPSSSQTITISETSSGHTQTQAPQNVTTAGNFTALSSWTKFSWDPNDYLSSAGMLHQPQTRSFTITESAINHLAIDGFEMLGRIELSYDSVQ